jgi:hypothetical protein
MMYMMMLNGHLEIVKVDIRFRTSCSICWHMLVMGDMIVVIICNNHYSVTLLLLYCVLLVLENEREGNDLAVNHA